MNSSQRLNRATGRSPRHKGLAGSLTHGALPPPLEVPSSWQMSTSPSHVGPSQDMHTRPGPLQSSVSPAGFLLQGPQRAEAPGVGLGPSQVVPGGSSLLFWPREPRGGAC